MNLLEALQCAIKAVNGVPWCIRRGYVVVAFQGDGGGNDNGKDGKSTHFDKKKNQEQTGDKGRPLVELLDLLT